MKDNINNKAKIRFPGCISTKMAPEDGYSSVKNCNETNIITSRKYENLRRSVSANLLLIVTVVGVIFGLVLGEFCHQLFHLHTWSVGSYSHRAKQNQ